MTGEVTAFRPAARLLDLTRLISRAGRVLTGVDRVELAYLRALITDDVPMFGLVRTSRGFILLDQAGAQSVEDRCCGRVEWGQMGFMARFLRKKPTFKRRAEADLRRVARARVIHSGLAQMLREQLPAGVSYLNTGHSNLGDNTLSAIRSVEGMHIGVLIHDTIPLDFPQYQRLGTPEYFEAWLRRAAGYSDVFIYNSMQTQRDCERHLGVDAPPGIVAHLGVDLPSVLDNEPDIERPYFVTVGTIEPRKNHALLLDIWDRWGEGAPRLVICGNRGWNNEEVFRRLDTSPLVGTVILEQSGLSDGAMAALVKGSNGLLFPSFTEGFGLPPVEAAAMGVPVVCGNLDIYREVLGDIPVYADTNDSYLWEQEIRNLAENQSGRASKPFKPPTWAAHFNTVLSMV